MTHNIHPGFVLKNHPVSTFIRALMPNATLEEQQEAQRNVDRYLDGIDRIFDQMMQEGETQTTTQPSSV